MNRRQSIQTLLGAGLLLPAPLFLMTSTHAAQHSQEDIERMRRNWRDLASAGFSPPSPDDALELSDEEWRRRLGEMEYRIMRRAGTERAYASPLNGESRDGLYACIGCDLPLFTSRMKYDSGTGWPSFFTTIPDVFDTSLDLKILLPRTEYHCRRCGSHHGHVFDDGPPPTDERWCNNGVALKFLPAND